MAIGKGLNAFLAAYYKAKESNSKDVYQAIQLAYLMNKLNTPKGATGEDVQAQARRDAAQGAYDKGSGGGLREGRSAAVSDPVSTNMAPHQRAFLNAVAAPESGGEYDRMYAGMGRDVPPTYFEGYDQHPDMGAPGPAGWSTAAGRYMFTKSTWDELGGGKFDPASQDQRAWALAQKRYAEVTGGDLDKELRTNGFTPKIASTLSPTWTGFKANPQLAADAYNASINRYTQPQVAGGVPSALPISSTAVANPALSAGPLPPPRSDNMGQALPVEAGVTAPTPTAYAPEAYPQAIPVDYAGYDPYNTEAVYAAKGGLVPDLRQRWVQHFQGGGGVEPDTGLLEPGNIDLNNRPVVRNPDGTISTVRSMGVNIDGQEVLLPTVSDDGRIMSDDAAVQQYMQTGRHLGKFRTPAASNAYAQRLHEMQAQQYGRGYARGGRVQHFQGGGDVLPYPPQFTYVQPDAPWAGQSPEPPTDPAPQFTYVNPNAPWAGQPMVANPYGDLVGPRGSPVGPQDFAPATTTPTYSPYGALPVTPASWDTPLPPRRPAGLGAAPVGGSGGALSAPLSPRRPDDLPDDQAAPQAQDQGWNGQISPDNPIAQLLTGVEHAVSGGVRWLTKTLGFNNDAIPTSSGGLQALANGDHALTQEEHDAVVNRVDPDNRLSPGIRNMVGMNAMYEYYLTNGSLDKAQKMAAGMLLYSEQYLRKAGYAALNDPDPRSAAKKLADGFNQVPNNQHMTVDGNGNFVFRNETTGKVISAGRYNPQQLLAAATGAANGSVFWQSLSQFAHKDDEVDNKQTAQQKNLQDMADRREKFDKVMGFVPPNADKPAPGAIPVSGAGGPATAGESQDEEEPDDASTEGRSASATQAIPTTPTAAIPKGVNKPAAQSAYVNMSPILDDEIAKNPEARKIWNEMSNPERQDARMVHNARVTRALEQAKIEQAKNAPDAPIKRTQLSAKDTEDQVNTAYTDHIEELKDKKDESGKPMKVPTPASARAFKGIAREIVKANADSGGADAIDKTASLVEFNPSNGVPYKVDKDRNGWFAKMNDTGDEIRLTPSGKVQLQRVVNAKIASADAAKQAAEKGGGAATDATTGVTRVGEGVAAILADRQAAAQQAAAQMSRRPAAPAAPVVTIPNPLGTAPATGAVMVPPHMPNPTYVVPRRALPVAP